jgi:hypothetical protein
MGFFVPPPSSGGGGPANTDALSEGSTNLYHTAARARAAITQTGKNAWVDVNYAGGSSDGSMARPFTTINAAIQALGVPTSSANEKSPRNIYIMGGSYDEDVLIGNGAAGWCGIWNLYAMGYVCIGNASGQYLASSTTRKVRYQIDFATRDPVDAVRPSLNLIACPIPPVSTHWTYAGNKFHISGDLEMVNVATGFNDAEIGLVGVKISGVVKTTPEAGSQSTHVKLASVFIDGSGGSFNSTTNLFYVKDCEFDGLITANQLGMIDASEIESVTFTSWASGTVKPYGFFKCSIAGTLTSGAGNYRADGTTQAHSSGIVLAGGATLTDLG